MADTTRTISPSQIKLETAGTWGGWQTYASSTEIRIAYNYSCMFRFDLTSVRIKELSLSFRISSRADFNRIKFVVYGDADFNTRLDTNYIDQFQTTGAVDETVSFSALPKDAAGLYVLVQGTSDYLSSYIYSLNATVTYEPISLTVNPSPATVYDIPSALPSYPNKVALTFGNRIGQTLNVKLKYNSTDVWEFYYIGTDTETVTMSGFFEAAGATGSSISVRVEVYDEIGRSANATFTLVKPQALTSTATAPKSTTVDGTLSINFAWSTSGGGTQTKAELQWSTDNAAWTDLATVNSAAQTWTAPALNFPGGTIYWRVRATNSFGTVGNWSSSYSSVSFTVKYDAVSQVVPVNSPTSGIINAANAITFGVALETTGQVYAPFTIASATFYWRAGTSGNWTSVAMTPAGTAAAVTIPANTFSHGTVQWYASATDNSGRTTETAVYTLTAMTAEVEAAPISPINTVESASGPIDFLWSYSSVDGSEETAAGLKWSQDGTNWTEYTLTKLGSNNLGVDRLTLPANTFAAGTVYWSVRSKNAANVWSDWSDVVSFRVFGAPLVAGVTADSKPFCTVTWQTEGQEAYEIEVDGEIVGRWFGATVRSYTTRAPLSDGQHKIRVRAQNKYSLWSEWAECTADIVNGPGVHFNVFVSAPSTDPAAIILMSTPPMAPIITRQPQDYRGLIAASFTVSYKMSGPVPGAYGCTVEWQYRIGPNAAWQAYTGPVIAGVAIVSVTQEMDGYQYRAHLTNRAGEIYSEPATFYYGEPTGPASELREGEWRAETGYFLIYRNGKLIAKTYNNYFTDAFVIGDAKYEVVQVIPDGYYTRGTALNGIDTVTVEAEHPIIFSVSDISKGAKLRLSKNRNRTQSFQRGRQTAYTYYAGAEYPEAVVGPQKSYSGTGDVSFTWAEKEQAAAFEALIGKAVCYKTNRGRMVIGVLDALPYEDEHFFASYTFTIRQMEWSDYVEE